MTRASDRHYQKRDAQASRDIMYAHVGQVRAANAAPTPDIAVKLRGLTPDDMNFIIDSWADSYRHSPDMRGVDPDLYKIEVRALIYALLPKTRQVVACDANHERNILGWICYSPATKEGQLATVHYALVKPDAQNRGIFKALLEIARASQSDPEGPIFCSLRTFPIIKWLAAKANLVYNPFILKHL